MNNVRFQPYRLGNSRCWDADDARISCLACHNPHEQLHRDVAFYDSKCTSCHVRPGTQPAKERPNKFVPLASRTA